MRFVSPEAFAKAFNMTTQVARRHFSKGKYKGETLPVVQVPGQRGGSGGMVWALNLDRCAPELQARLAVVETPVESLIEEALKGQISARQWNDQAARLRIIQPILGLTKGTPERAEAFRQVASQTHAWRDGAERFAENTLRDWVLDYEERGTSALLGKSRSDRGSERVTISREWDAGVGLPEDRRTEVAHLVARTARSMIYNDGTSAREALRVASDTLCRLSSQAGSALAVRDLRKLCNLNTRWGNRTGLKRYRLGYLAKKDHKNYQDGAVARNSMAVTAVPMDLVQGDVHYVAILVKDEGEPIRLRLIAWLDMSSLFLWVTPVLLSKGNGIVQADIAESLFDLTACPHGGIPKEFYLDNGSEYSALSAAMSRLAVLSERTFGLTLAKPYSPTSKGSIEGLFHVLEDVFKGLPGWIGGRRDNKKSANKGKVVAPYSKGPAQLVEDIHACVAIYNSRPQSAGSRIAGMSPKEVYEMKALSKGFRPRHFSELAFDLTFSKTDTKIVRQSAVKIDGRNYNGDYLHGLMPGEKVEVLLPLRRGLDHAWVNVPGCDPQLIEAAPIFAYGDRAGAKHQSALEGKSNRAVAALRRDIDPNISTFELQKQAADMMPPNIGQPEVWTPRVIDKTAPRSAESAAEMELANLLRKKTFITDEMKKNQRRMLQFGQGV